MVEALWRFSTTFAKIHTKRRNRLTTERLNCLVYIQFNNRLMSKREKVKQKKNYEVLLSSNAAEAQGFFYEGGDTNALVVFRDEDEGEVPGTGIPWSVLGQAMGVEEVLEPHRSARVARQVREVDDDEEEWQSEEEEAPIEDNMDMDSENQDDGDEILDISAYVP